MHICPLCAGAVLAAGLALWRAVRGWYRGCEVCQHTEDDSEEPPDSEPPPDSDHCCEHKEN